MVMRSNRKRWLSPAAMLMPLVIASILLAQVTIVPRTVTTPNFDVDWSTTPAYKGTNSPDPEEIDTIHWSSTPPPSGPNLTNTFTSSTSCFNGDVEYFGNAWAPPDPQIGGTVLVGAGAQGTWAVGPDQKVIINSSALASNCTAGTAGPAVYAGVPVATEYQFWDNPAAQSSAGPWDRIKVTRQFTFATAFNPNVCGTNWCFRAYIPRLHPTSVFSEVLYPTPGSTVPASISVFSCPFGCTGVSAPGASTLTPPWDATKRWFAINAPSTNEGVIVTRISTSPADLWVDFDGGSDTNSSSILLLAPAGGFTGTVTEREMFCFYDLTTWPLAMRSAGMLPHACGQHRAP